MCFYLKTVKFIKFFIIFNNIKCVSINSVRRMFKFKKLKKYLMKSKLFKTISKFYTKFNLEKYSRITFNVLLNGFLISIILHAFTRFNISLFTILGAGISIRYFESYLKLFKRNIIEILRAK